MPLGASSSLLPRLVLLLKIHIHPPTTLVSPQIHPTVFHASCSSLTWSALVIKGCKLCPLQSPPFRIKGKPARISPNFRDPTLSGTTCSHSPQPSWILQHQIPSLALVSPLQHGELNWAPHQLRVLPSSTYLVSVTHEEVPACLKDDLTAASWPMFIQEQGSREAVRLRQVTPLLRLE